MKRDFREDSRVKIFVGSTLAEVEKQVIDFISDKLVLDIEYNLIENPTSHRIIVLYRSYPSFSQNLENSPC